MTPKGYGVIIGHRELLYDLEGHGDLCNRFDPVYDPSLTTPAGWLSLPQLTVLSRSAIVV